MPTLRDACRICQRARVQRARPKWPLEHRNAESTTAFTEVRIAGVRFCLRPSRPAMARPAPAGLVWGGGHRRRPVAVPAPV